MKHLKGVSSFVTLLMEGIGMVILLGFAAVSVLLWRIGEEPVDLAFAKPYIEQALNSGDQPFKVSLDKAVLAWPERKGPVLLSLQNVSLDDKSGGQKIFSVKKAYLSFSYPHLIVGEIRPVTVMLLAPTVTLERKDGQVKLFLEEKDGVPSDKPDASSSFSIKESLPQIIERLDNPNLRVGVFQALKALKIRNADVVIKDLNENTEWTLHHFHLLVQDADQGVGVQMTLPMPGPEDADNGSLETELAYRRETGDFALEANFDRVNPAAFAEAVPGNAGKYLQDLLINGHVSAVVDQGLTVKQARLSLEIPDGKINYPAEFDSPVPVTNAKLAGAYSDAAHTLELTEIQAGLAGIDISGTGKVVLSDGRIDVPLHLTVPGPVPVGAIAPVYPKSEKDGEAARWLLHLLTDGTFSDVAFQTTLSAVRQTSEDSGESWSVKEKGTLLDFAFDGMTVKYSDTLMPAKNAKGKGRLDIDAGRLDITGDSVDVGDVKGREATLAFTDIMVRGGGYADIQFKAKGPLATAFQYISDEPISMGDKLGFDTKGVKGIIDMATQIEFPTIKDMPKEVVKVKVDATLTDVFLPKIVEGLDLSGGPMTLHVGEGSFGVKGNGQLAGRDVTFDWMQYFDPAGKPFDYQIKAKISADEELRHHFGIGLDEYLAGPLPVDVIYTSKPDKTSTVDVTGDVNPLTITVDAFGYKKDPGVDGQVKLNVVLTKGVLKSIQNLSLDTKGFMISGGRLSFAPMNGKNAELKAGHIDRATIGNTTAEVDFEITPENVLKVVAKANLLDIEPFTEKDVTHTDANGRGSAAKKEHQPMMISATADKIRMKEGRSFGDSKLYLETDTDGDITRLEMDSVAGDGTVTVRFKPDASGKRTFRMEADDAGAFLNSADLYDNIRGGKLLVYGEPKTDDLRGDLSGTAQIENFKIVKAPSLAKLLSIMSLGGMVDLLSNEGLAFSKLESGFEWRFRPQGNLLMVQDGRTSGASIGLTFGGTFDRATNQMDIQGTIIPMTEINSLLNAIPVVGDLLTGGSGLIAATYTMKGPSSDPQVSINPLSVLTPGFLRKILFEGGYEKSVPAEE